MGERTEEERVAQAPFPVILGGQEYQIKPLVIRDSRVWRKGIVSIFTTLPSMLKALDDSTRFGEVITKMLVTQPDQVVDLFFEYAKDLDRQEIEAVTTDSELAIAFEKVIEVAFPLAESLPKAMERLNSQ